MIMGFFPMVPMIVLVGAVIPGVIVAMIRLFAPVGVPMSVFMIVPVRMGMFMRVAMFLILVLMMMFMGVLVFMCMMMLVFVIAFHRSTSFAEKVFPGEQSWPCL